MKLNDHMAIYLPIPYPSPTLWTQGMLLDDPYLPTLYVYGSHAALGRSVPHPTPYLFV